MEALKHKHRVPCQVRGVDALATSKNVSKLRAVDVVRKAKAWGASTPDGLGDVDDNSTHDFAWEIHDDEAGDFWSAIDSSGQYAPVTVIAAPKTDVIDIVRLLRGMADALEADALVVDVCTNLGAQTVSK